MAFTILGTGSFLPEHTVTNDDLAQIVETSDEWITQRIGVRSRHISETDSNVDMAEKAARAALENAGVKPGELDLIIASTITGDSISPGTACMVQARIGASCPAFDVTAACCGFLFALETAAGYAARGVRHILVVSSERTSGIIDWTDRGTCCIFGDGAGAAVLGPGDGLLASRFITKGNDEIINIPTNYDASPWYKNEVHKSRILMNGRAPYKFAVIALSDNVRAVIGEAGLTPEDIDWVFPHQANLRIIQEASRRLPEIADEKFCVNIDRCGNTSSASIPILLDEAHRAGKLKRGDKIVMAAFGSGLSAGAMVIRF